jgi:coenzyme F420-dependent glucose-6-phosphate dehydrogenase
MHDERVVLGLSTGEAMNETPLGHDWPDYPVRRDRLEETLDVVHSLWGSDGIETAAEVDADGFVDYDGDHFQLNDARLYTLPEERPEVHIAANGPATASLTSDYGDGFNTVVKGQEYTDQLYPAVRSYTEDAGRDPDAIETTLLVIASYGEDYEAAVESTRPWWATTQDVFDRALANPREIEAEGERATREQIEAKFVIADDPADLAATFARYAEMGFDRIAVGNTSPDPELFFEVMGDEVIPSL